MSENQNWNVINDIAHSMCVSEWVSECVRERVFSCFNHSQVIKVKNLFKERFVKIPIQLGFYYQKWKHTVCDKINKFKLIVRIIVVRVLLTLSTTKLFVLSFVRRTVLSIWTNDHGHYCYGDCLVDWLSIDFNQMLNWTLG